MAEFYFIDGQALTPSSFGETDAITGRWKAKAYSGTYGTNGFYLKFADNSGTTSTTLGKDSSGNGNNWTPNNFSVTAGAGNDSLVDSPTNYGTDSGVGGEVRGNYATLNPLLVNTFLPYVSLSNGNLFVTGNSTLNDGFVGSTISVKTGKWYWEYTSSSFDATGYQNVGVNPPETIITSTGYAGANPNSTFYATTGMLVKFGGNTSNWGSTWGANDVIGVALDCDNGAIYFSKNNVWQNSGIPTSGASRTGSAVTWTGGAVELTPTMDMYKSGSNGNINFGQRPFAYTAPSGFKALCTTNLPQPTIQKPSRYMDVVAYTGTGASNSISSLGFSPDLVWIKNRGTTTSHAIYDTTRGSQNQLSSDTTGAEVTSSTGLTAFGSNGFTIGTSSLVNTSGTQYVAWAWDEAPIAGMDIVAYTGTGANRTIAHNLGVAPKMIIVKNRNFVGSTNWCVYHSSLSSPANSVFLDTTDAQASYPTVWNSTAPTSSVFSVGTNLSSNGNGNNMIAYLFAEVEGFSKFGSYTGNGSADGPFVWCGFRPRWVLIKMSSSTGDWYLFDTARDTFNATQLGLIANSSQADGTYTGWGDITSNGFKVRRTDAAWNTSGGTYIFAAFAESPFKYARAR